MLCRYQKLRGSRILALDGYVGRIRDACFHDHTWMVQYLVAAAGARLFGRKVLISPGAVDLIDHRLHSVLVSRTRASITATASNPGERGKSVVEQPCDAHLRSASKLSGYALNAVDGYAGRVRDLFFDDETWAVRYLVVQTASWPFGRRVLVSRDRVRRVDWAGGLIEVDQTREQIAHGSKFDATHPPPGDFARRLGLRKQEST
jgi:hypothetical protein